MHPYLMQEIAASASRTCAGGTALRPGWAPQPPPVTAARTTRPVGGSMRSKPMILVALLLAAFR